MSDEKTNTVPQEDQPERTGAERRRSDRRLEDRRQGDRRQGDRRAGYDRRSGLDRRRGPGRRRSDTRRAAEEGEMTDEQFEFIMAVNEYKRVNAKPFPTFTEMLDIVHALGYRKVAEPSDIR